jgi:hypothetical protein
LAAAKEAVNGLKPSDISDMTKINNPARNVCVTLIYMALLLYD